MKINLLPVSMRRGGGKGQRLFFLIAAGVLLMLVPMYLTYSLYLEVSRQAVSEEALRGRLIGLPPLDALQAERDNLKRQIATLEEARAMAAPFAPTKHLAELLRLLPPRTALTSLRMEAEQLHFSGTVGSLSEASMLLQLLQTSTLYQDPVITSLSAEQRGYRFAASVKLVGGGR
ncbi:MAG: hypothetical protein DDT35_01306 [Firmicutes bacterium]|nr:hypothetical protein [Bacillota bacterium]